MLISYEALWFGGVQIVKRDHQFMCFLIFNIAGIYGQMEQNNCHLSSQTSIKSNEENEICLSLVTLNASISVVHTSGVC